MRVAALLCCLACLPAAAIADLPDEVQRYVNLVDACEAAELVLVGQTRQRASRVATVSVTRTLRGSRAGATLTLLAPDVPSGPRLFLLTTPDGGNASPYQGRHSRWAHRPDRSSWALVGPGSLRVADGSVELGPGGSLVGVPILARLLARMKQTPADRPAAVVASTLEGCRSPKTPPMLRRLLGVRLYLALRFGIDAHPAARRPRYLEGKPRDAALELLLDGKDPVLASLGLWLIGEARATGRIAAVVRWMDSKSLAARVATQLLGRLGDPRGIEPLGRLATNVKAPRDRREEAVGALARLGRQLPAGARAALLPVFDRLAATPGPLAPAVIRALRIVRLPASLPLLARFVGPASRRTSRLAVLGLTELTGLPIRHDRRVADQQAEWERVIGRWRRAYRTARGVVLDGRWPAPNADLAARIRRWIAALDHDQHEMRRMAQRTLGDIGVPAHDALVALRKGSERPEARRRATLLLAAPALADPQQLLDWIARSKLTLDGPFLRSLRKNEMP